MKFLLSFIFLFINQFAYAEIDSSKIEFPRNTEVKDFKVFKGELYFLSAYHNSKDPDYKKWFVRYQLLKYDSSYKLVWSQYFDFPGNGYCSSLLINGNDIFFSVNKTEIPSCGVVICTKLNGDEKWRLVFDGDYDTKLHLFNDYIYCNSKNALPLDTGSYLIRKISTLGKVQFESKQPLQSFNYILSYSNSRFTDYSYDSFFVEFQSCSNNQKLIKKNGVRIPTVSNSEEFTLKSFCYTVNKLDGNASTIRELERNLSDFCINDSLILCIIKSIQWFKMPDKFIPLNISRLNRKNGISEDFFIDTITAVIFGTAFFDWFTDSSILLVKNINREVGYGGISIIEFNVPGKIVRNESYFPELDATYYVSTENGIAYIYCILINRKNGFEIVHKIIKVKSYYR